MGISPQLTLYLSFPLPYGVHVCTVIIYEVMEIYSYIELTCTKLMNCES